MSEYTENKEAELKVSEKEVEPSKPTESRDSAKSAENAETAFAKMRIKAVSNLSNSPRSTITRFHRYLSGIFWRCVSQDSYKN